MCDSACAGGQLELCTYDAPRPEAAAILRGLGADVVAVQELQGTPEDGRRLLMDLAEAADMSCDVGDGLVALVVADTGLHVGLMWSQQWRCWPQWWVSIGHGELWHALILATLTNGERWLRTGSYHASPFNPSRRTQDAQLEVDTATSSMLPTVVAGDWNAVSADRDPLGDYYDPDPYQDVAWYPELRYQLPEGQWDPPYRADRTPSEVLLRGGLNDFAAVAGGPWEATSGHWPTDPHPPRRVDAIRVSNEWVGRPRIPHPLLHRGACP